MIFKPLKRIGELGVGVWGAEKREATGPFLLYSQHHVSKELCDGLDDKSCTWTHPPTLCNTEFLLIQAFVQEQQKGKCKD